MEREEQEYLATINWCMAGLMEKLGPCLVCCCVRVLGARPSKETSMVFQRAITYTC